MAKNKSLTAGRILSLVPLVLVALFFASFMIDSVFFNSISPFAHNIFLMVSGVLMTLSTVPSFICSVVALVFLNYARKRGGRKIVPFIVFSILGMIFSVLLTLLFFVFIRGFESTVDQLDKLSKISAIEEFVLTDDSEEGGAHEGIMHNDLDLYLKDGGFLQVENMSEYLTKFWVKSAGDWNLFIVHEKDDGQLIQQAWLAQEELSKLCGKKIKKLTDLISNYDSFIKKVEELPLVEENPTKTGFYKRPLNKQKLALRENVIYEDIARQKGVVSVKKINGHYDYLENYWYEILMDDGHTLLMTVSAVFPQDNGSIKSNYCIRMFDNEPISLLSMTNTTCRINYYRLYSDRELVKKIGVEMNSYRDFFPHYKEFLELTDELLEESKKAKDDKNKNNGSGMMSGMYSSR